MTSGRYATAAKWIASLRRGRSDARCQGRRCRAPASAATRLRGRRHTVAGAIGVSEQMFGAK